MPVETATYIHDLNQADPAHTDGLNQADQHIRLLKTVLQNTLPNATAPITGTPAQLNAVAAMAATPGVVEVPAGTTASAVVKLKAVTGSGSVLIQNTGVNGNFGALTISINDQKDANTLVSMVLSRLGNLTVPGSLNGASIQKGGFELVPTGIICMWAGAANAIPLGWHLCDGNGGTPNLKDRFIIGAGGGAAVAQQGGALSSTVATDAQGTHAHTTLTVTAGPFAMTGSSDAQGAHSHGGADGSHALSVAELPPHVHGGIASGSGASLGASPGNVGATPATTDGGQGLAGAGHSHTISVDGNHAHNIFVSNAPAHQHGILGDGNHAHNVTVAILPPYYALCFIMKL